jgi:hypothetical protein
MYEMVITFIDIMGGVLRKINYLMPNLDDATDRAKWFSTFENVNYVDIIDLMTGEVMASFSEGKYID